MTSSRMLRLSCMHQHLSIVRATEIRYTYASVCPDPWCSSPQRIMHRLLFSLCDAQLRRDPCPLDTKPGAWYFPAKVGDAVARGPKWQRGDMSDGGPGGLGTVIELTQSSMAVSGWEKKRSSGGGLGRLILFLIIWPRRIGLGHFYCMGFVW